MTTKNSIDSILPILIKDILVPVDFSPTSANALFFANQLSRKLNAKITLLHAFPLFPAQKDKLDEKYIQTFEVRKKDSIEKLNKLCKVVKNTTGEDCLSVHYEGLVKDVIIQYVNEQKPDLLVIGTNEHSTFRKILLGTVTGNVMKECECTMLVVPEKASSISIKKIAFFIDYHESDINEISFLIHLAHQFDSELHLIRIATDELNTELEKSYFTAFKERVRPLPSSNKIKFQLIEGNNITKEIKKYAESNDIGTLVVAKSDKSSLEAIFLGSVTQNLFNHTTTPLLIFHAEDKSNDFF